jgi:hypothetical protein
LLTAAYTTLASDGANINILAFHQFKPLDNGLGYQTRRVIPPKTPRELVDGHKVHMHERPDQGARRVVPCPAVVGL